MLSPFEKQYLEGKETGKYTYEPDADFVREQLYIVINEIFNDRKIYAIKALRSLTALGLKDSKEVVEHLQEKILTQDSKSLKYKNEQLTEEIASLRKDIYRLAYDKRQLEDSMKVLEATIQSNEHIIEHQEKIINETNQIRETQAEAIKHLNTKATKLMFEKESLIKTIKIFSELV